MSLIYDYRWLQNLDTMQSQLRIAEWLTIVDSYDEETIDRALDYCANGRPANKNGEHWPPNIPEFADICRANKKPEVKIVVKKTELEEKIEREEKRLRDVCSTINHYKIAGIENKLVDSFYSSKKIIEEKLSELYLQKKKTGKAVECGNVW
jgi:hypothetical protein